MVPQKDHHRNEIIFLMSFLLVFAVIFLIALLGLLRGTPVFGFGLPYLIEDALLMVLAFLAILKVLWHILVH